MKQLTKEEIKFVQETGFTPTVFQCNEYHRTPFKDFEEACKVAQDKYNIDLDEFLSKNISIDLDDSDGISLEYVATYLFYCFFTKEELEQLTPIKALEWLQDYRYFCGFRKWDEQLAFSEVQEAIEIHNGTRVLYLESDGNVWNWEKEDFENNEHFKDKQIIF